MFANIPMEKLSRIATITKLFHLIAVAMPATNCRHALGTVEVTRT